MRATYLAHPILVLDQSIKYLVKNTGNENCSYVLQCRHNAGLKIPCHWVRSFPYTIFQFFLTNVWLLAKADFISEFR
jgi:hypothetical protein